MNKLHIKLIGPGLLALAVGVLSAFSSLRPDTPRETRTVGAFIGISLGGSAHVIVKQGSPQSVVVEASPEALAEFETVVDGQQLRLGYRHDKNNYNHKDRGPVTVYVTAPRLAALKVGGSGKLEVDGPLKADAMQLAVTGSGYLQVPQLTAGALETVLSGSGNVQVGGSSLRHDIRVSGSGNVKAHDLKAENCRVRISGSGDVHLYASRAAEAAISGSGSVYVAGGGQLSSKVSGSGRIAKE